MSLTVKLVISLVIAAIASTLTSVLRGGGVLDPALLAAFCIATAATALLVSAQGASNHSKGHKPGPSKAARRPAPPTAARRPAPTDTAREQGEVKWFNAAKGFGFIIREDGEEIFVHFRSIRGEGRRGLRDGQQVSFVVANSDKGPQAEDVEAID